jgi:sec-independent protein translocase protein TatC
MVFLYKILLPVSLVFLIAFGTHLVETSTPGATLPADALLTAMPILEGDPDTSGMPIGAMWVNTHLGELRVKIGPGEVRGIRLTGKGAISQQYRIGDYISLIFTLGLVFAIAFQLPLALLLLSWAGILEASDLKPFRRHAALVAGALGAILTPQDPGSMIMLGVALYILFEFGLVLMRFVPARVVAEGFGAGKAGARRPPTDGREGDE